MEQMEQKGEDSKEAYKASNLQNTVYYCWEGFLEDKHGSFETELEKVFFVFTRVERVRRFRALLKTFQRAFIIVK